MVDIDYIKNNPITKSKANTLKQLKALKNNKFIDNRLYYYLKPTDSLALRFYGQPKMHKPGVQYVLLFHILASHCAL